MIFIMLILGLILGLVGAGLFFLMHSANKMYREQRRKQKDFLRHAVKTKGTIFELKQVRLAEPIRTRGGGRIYDVICPVYEYTDLNGNKRILDTEIEQKGLYNQYQFFIPNINVVSLYEGDQKTIYYRPDTGEQYVDYNMTNIKILTNSGFVGFMIYSAYAISLAFLLGGVTLILTGIMSFFL